METEVTSIRLSEDRADVLRRVSEELGVSKRSLFEMMVDGLEVVSRPEVRVDPARVYLDALAAVGLWLIEDGAYRRISPWDGSVECVVCGGLVGDHGDDCPIPSALAAWRGWRAHGKAMRKL